MHLDEIKAFLQCYDLGMIKQHCKQILQQQKALSNEKMFCQESQWPLQASALLKGEMEPAARACELFSLMVGGGSSNDVRSHKPRSSVT